MKPQVSFKALPIAARLAVVLFGLAGFAAILDAISWQHAFAPGRVLLLFAVAVSTARAPSVMAAETTAPRKTAARTRA